MSYLYDTMRRVWDLEETPLDVKLCTIHVALHNIQEVLLYQSRLTKSKRESLAEDLQVLKSYICELQEEVSCENH